MSTQQRVVRIAYDFTVTSRSIKTFEQTRRSTEQVERRSRDLITTSRNLARALNEQARSADRASTGMRRLSGSMTGVANRMGNMVRTLFSWRTMLVGYLSGRAMHGAINALVMYNAKIEEFRVGIAMSLNQMTDWNKSFGGVKDKTDRWTKSMHGAVAITEALRRVAARSAGSFDEYVQGFQLINSSILAVGGNARDTMDVIKMLVPLTKAAGRDIMTGSMDLNQMLRGDTNLRQINLPFFRDPEMLAAIKVAKGDKKKGVAADPKKALEIIKTHLNRAQVAADEYAKSFAAQLETLTDNWRAFAGEVGQPIFQRLTKELTKYNREWSVTHGRMADTGRMTGEWLVKSFDKLKDSLERTKTKLKEIAAVLIQITKIGVGAKAGGMLTGIGAFGMARPGRREFMTDGMIRSRALGNIQSGMPGATAEQYLAKNAAKRSVMQAGALGTSAAMAAGGGPRTVGMARGLAGSGVLALLGIGVAIEMITGRSKELAKQEGMMGGAAKEASKAIEGLKSVMTGLADLSIMLIGAIASMGTAIGEFAAKVTSIAYGMAGNGAKLDAYYKGKSVITNEDKGKYSKLTNEANDLAKMASHEESLRAYGKIYGSEAESKLREKVAYAVSRKARTEAEYATDPNTGEILNWSGGIDKKSLIQQGLSANATDIAAREAAKTAAKLAYESEDLGDGSGQGY